MKKGRKAIEAEAKTLLVSVIENISLANGYMETGGHYDDILRELSSAETSIARAKAKVRSIQD